MSDIKKVEIETLSKLHEDLLTILGNEVKPALGCTEPVAVGLAVAKAKKNVDGEIQSVKVKTSPNIYKNGMGVGIPGTEDTGLVFAAALAAVVGNSDLGLEVFDDVNEYSIKKAKQLIKNNIVEVGVETEKGNFYIESYVTTTNGSSYCIIKDSHTNVVKLVVDGKTLVDKTEELEKENKSTYGNLSDYSLVEIREFAETVPFKEIKWLLEGVKMNKEIAEKGFELKPGPGLGSALSKLIDEGTINKDMVNEARMITSAACDARMAGLKMPVMSSAGSGNHGITAIIPPTVVCEHLGCDEEKLARTLAISHLVTSYIKNYTGRLSAVCGCAIAAGIGASVGITWALGGNDKQMGGAVNNMAASLSGMVCDGAKGGCAFKLSTAAAEAIIQAKLAIGEVYVSQKDGIIGKDAESTIKNLGKFCINGMSSADDSIIKIMLNNNK